LGCRGIAREMAWAASLVFTSHTVSPRMQRKTGVFELSRNLPIYKFTKKFTRSGFGFRFIRLMSLNYCRGFEMAKLACLDDEDRKLLAETMLKLDEATKLMAELMETIEVLKDEGMMKAIREGQEDIKAGRVKELRSVLKETAH